MGLKTKTDEQAPAARLDPTLTWHQAPSAKWWTSNKQRVIAIGPRGGEYEVVALDAVRALCHNVVDDQSALTFIHRFGPLVEEDTLQRNMLIGTQRTLVSIWSTWQLGDTPAATRLNRGAQAARATPQDSYMPMAIGAAWAASVEVAARAEGYTDILAVRQAYTLPRLTGFPMKMRLWFDDDNQLAVRPLDLRTAMFMALAQRIMAGDAAVQCRRLGCKSIVPRWLSNGNSMKSIYCSDACRMTVKRHVEQDRYPQLRGLSRGEFVKAARKLRGEVL